MQTLSAKKAKPSFVRPINLGRAEPAAVTKHGRTVGFVPAAGEYERLKALDLRKSPNGQKVQT